MHAAVRPHLHDLTRSGSSFVQRTARARPLGGGSLGAAEGGIYMQASKYKVPTPEVMYMYSAVHTHKQDTHRHLPTHTHTHTTLSST